jgi:hypothetical protein
MCTKYLTGSDDHMMNLNCGRYNFVCIWRFGPNFSNYVHFSKCSVYSFSHYNCFCDVAAQGSHFVDTAFLILLRTKLTYGFRLQVLYNSI